MGGAAHAVSNAFSNPIRGLTAIGTFGTSELARKMGPIPRNLASLPENVANGILGTKFGQTGTPDIGGSGPFQIDQGQMMADQAAISDLGQKQFDSTNQFVNQDQGARELGRNRLASALTQQSQDMFKQSLPATEETLNAQHLLNGSGLGQELARQQGNISTNIANQIGTLGANDIDAASQQRAAALTGLHGTQTAGLQRGLGMEDFINQANVAKTIGAQMAPPPPSSKANFGAAAQGIGALAPYARMAAGK